MREIGVGLLGLGNVGAGVMKLLQDNVEAIEARLGARLIVRSAAVRQLDKPRPIPIDKGILTTNLDDVVDRDDVEIVCELIGGVTDARMSSLRAVERKKQLVTANKALLAEHGEEVFAAAEAAGVDLYYEAAVCGGIPIIRTLREGLASDRIETIYGIVNGTSNYILTAMAEHGTPFAEVLLDAQKSGYAEADPTLDIGGGDAAHKLAILAMLAFGTRIDVSSIFVQGIEGLDPIDFEYAARFGYVVKPLAIARALEDKIEARVHPAMVPKQWLLADVAGAQNAVYVRSYALGPSLYYGAGAGMMPTAMAVVSDLIEVGRNILAKATATLPLRSYQQLSSKSLRDISELQSCYYLRFGVLDQPGVLGQLTTILGQHQISIAQVVQEGPRAPDLPVRVVVMSHQARERSVQQALAQIAQLSAVIEPAVVIRIAE